MATVIVSNELSTLKLYRNKGLDVNSKEIKDVISFPDIKSDASDQNVLDVANAIAAVQKHEIYNIVKLDNVVLS